MELDEQTLSVVWPALGSKTVEDKTREDSSEVLLGFKLCLLEYDLYTA